MPSWYPENNRILPSDDSNRTLHKIASLNGAGSGTSGGGGGVIGFQQVYVDRAPGAPDDPTIPAINLRSDGGSWTMWNPSAGTWA